MSALSPRRGRRKAAKPWRRLRADKILELSLADFHTLTYFPRSSSFHSATLFCHDHPKRQSALSHVFLLTA
ncbi:hypothetical protein Cob_v002207 [Colletotrichum orbiculare MAFF 240422]|uniref:Uncharacterized protein n=1 Tax=Colletotrichum orbiculare (strain 104-T / ATCC 96160 / CBS 514.97 / LARS 414 / MAFF 240422) TaxID=1213857 RepID=A0A484G5A5_COLOR|nr:hypothetical protein Cob_v002207 [Colletotrichum orbiculare MAFF 240422]